MRTFASVFAMTRDAASIAACGAAISLPAHRETPDQQVNNRLVR